MFIKKELKFKKKQKFEIKKYVIQLLKMNITADDKCMMNHFSQMNKLKSILIKKKKNVSVYCDLNMD